MAQHFALSTAFYSVTRVFFFFQHIFYSPKLHLGCGYAQKKAFSGLNGSTQRFYVRNKNSSSINGNCLVILRADMDPRVAMTAEQCHSVTLTVIARASISFVNWFYCGRCVRPTRSSAKFNSREYFQFIFIRAFFSSALYALLIRVCASAAASMTCRVPPTVFVSLIVVKTIKCENSWKSR